MEEQKNYRILELHMSNIKRIKMVDITPKKNIVILEGDNAQGKTSILDGIAYLIGGKTLIPEEPIRQGEKTGFVSAVIGDFEVSRRWTNPYTSYLNIKPKEGAEPKSPQNFLNEKIGKISLEVAELVNMPKDKRVDLFKKITGLELDDLKSKHIKVMESRKDERKAFERLEREAENYTDLPEMGEDVNFDDLQKERREKEEANKRYRNKEEERGSLVYGKADLELKIKDTHDEIKKYENAIKELTDLNETRKQQVLKGQIEIDKLTEEYKIMPQWDLSEIDEKIKKAMGMQELKFKYGRRDEIEGEMVKVSKKVDKYNLELAGLQDEKQKRIKEATIPVEGIEFDGEIIKYNGIEFEECSTAEQIEMSIAIGIKENPEIRILLIRDGSAIGASAMDRIKKLAKDNNFQIWVERVAETKGNEIFIEDGEIK